MKSKLTRKALLIGMLAFVQPAYSAEIELTDGLQDLNTSTLTVNFVSPVSSRIVADKLDELSHVEGTTRFTIVPLTATFAMDPENKKGNVFNGKFSDTYLRQLMDETELCTKTEEEKDGFGNIIAQKLDIENPTPVELLQHCSNDYPDEFKAFVGMMHPYTEWKTKEQQGILRTYIAKTRSGKLADRLEGRLMTACMERFVATMGENEEEASLYELHENQDTDQYNASTKEFVPVPDLSSMLQYCSNAEHWNIFDIFPKYALESCSDEVIATTEENFTHPDEFPDLQQAISVEKGLTEKETAEKYVFDFQTFIRGCVVTEKTSNVDSEKKLSEGVDAAIGMIPAMTIKLERVDVPADEKSESAPEDGSLDKQFDLKIQSYPSAIKNESLYDALYVRAYNLIASEGFSLNQTQGCIPSPFAPSDFVELVNSDSEDWKRYCSIWIPKSIVTVMSSAELGKDANFIWALIAKKIAVIQTLEVLSGAQLIAQETERFFQGTDRELYRMFQPSVQYSSDVVKLYRESVDLAQASTLEDVLTLVNKTLQARSDSIRASEMSRANSLNYSFK